ncbi:unnamed protein product [Lymnaea stagnalis]|uniref:Uncharacterized protein n=1 Tax=Lymnaea stagnalis TaxID=6523 RepID=A0AAV2I1S9_LYMST
MATKRKPLTLEQRMEALQKIDAGWTLKQVAEQFNCGMTQISQIKRKREEVLKLWEEGGRADRKHVKKRKSNYEELNSKVFHWYCEKRASQFPIAITGKRIQEKGVQLAKELSLDDFKASNGWLESWQRLYNVKSDVRCGESAGVAHAAVDDLVKLPDICKGYAQVDIFNAVETVMYYRSLAKTSMVEKDDSKKGIKTTKERMTVLLACSAAGEKLKPLVIGRTENPRCFKNVEKSSLGVDYEGNKNSWMTTTIFTSWLQKLNDRMRAEGRDILLLLDNCTAHPHMELSNINLQYLPPNPTSKLHPLESGVITTFKALYKKHMLLHLLAGVEEASAASQQAKSITLLDAIGWLTVAWTTGVKASTCVGCFAHCSLVDSRSSPSQEEGSPPPPDQPHHQLLESATSQDHAGTADAAATMSIDSTSPTVAVVKHEAEEEEDAVDDAGQVLTSKEALEQAKKLLRFANVKGNVDLKSTAMKMVSSIEDICMQETSKAKAKQTSIKDFFCV